MNPTSTINSEFNPERELDPKTPRDFEEQFENEKESEISSKSDESKARF